MAIAKKPRGLVALQSGFDSQANVRLDAQLWWSLEVMPKDGDGEVELALARTGVLGLLVCWAAANCSLPQRTVGLTPGCTYYFC